jgi:hypothetical protein
MAARNTDICKITIFMAIEPYSHMKIDINSFGLREIMQEKKNLSMLCIGPINDDTDFVEHMPVFFGFHYVPRD